MRINWKVAASLILFLNTATLMAQSLRQEKIAIQENKIILKKTICIVYNNGQQVDSFFSASTSYNKHGYSLQHTIFKKNGAVQGKFRSEYEADSLEIKVTAFDSLGNISTETLKEYDADG